MILTGAKIYQELKKGNISIEPFSEDLLNPNSYNIRLGSNIYEYVYDDYLDPINEPILKRKMMQNGSIILKPNRLYLGHTIEIIGSNSFVPLIGGRSSTGRIGLFVHITAPLGDIGYFGQWTLQLRATVPVKVYEGQKIGQMIFVKPFGEVSQYGGKYQNGKGAQSYRTYIGENIKMEKDPYSEMSNFYDNLDKVKTKKLEEEIKKIVDNTLKYSANKASLIDIGCGLGLHLRAFEKKREIKKIVGIDRSQQSISYCKEHLNRSLLINSDYFTLDSTKDRYDIILALAFIHLFPKSQLKNLLNDFSRNLSPSGVVVLSTSIHTTPSEGLEDKNSLEGAKRYRARYSYEEIKLRIEENWDILFEWKTKEIFDNNNPKEWQYFIIKSNTQRKK